MKKLFLIPLLLIFLITTHCDKSPTGPDLQEESKNIPWHLITGKIAYSRSEIDGDVASYLFILDGNSRKVNLVKEVVGTSFTGLSWKYDGNLITFSGFDHKKSFWQLYSIQSDGKNLSNTFPADAHCNYPAWSKDGRLAYWYNNGWPHMHEIRIDGNAFFGKASCDQSRPAWSPDGKFLVISMYDSCSQGSLYLVNLLDTSVTPLLRAKGAWDEEIFAEPIYSHDGSKIAFMKFGSSTGNNSEIWVINSDGSSPERFTSGNTDNYPAWSPDGRYIAFSRLADGKSKIFMLSINDRSITQITEKEAQYPVWIP